MLTLFVSAFLLGLIFNAAPGAVFAETVRQGLRGGGYRPALFVQIGSLVGDGVWAVLGLLGVGLLLQFEALRLPSGTAGALYLLWLAWDSWCAAGHVVDTHARNADEPAAVGGALRSGVLMSITNSQNVAYWAALGGAMGVGVADPTVQDYALFLAGFMASSVVWAFVCAAIVARLFRDAGAGWARLTYRNCAIAFLLLALSSLRELWNHVGGSRAAGIVSSTRNAH